MTAGHATEYPRQGAGLVEHGDDHVDHGGAEARRGPAEIPLRLAERARKVGRGPPWLTYAAVMVVLVTGGAGFVGSHVVEALAGAGHDVRVLDLRAGGDVRDPDVVRRAVAGVDHVCHQAAMVGLGTDIGDIADYVSHNDLGTAVLLRALARRRFAGRLVLASSMVVYGEGRYRCGDHGVVAPGAAAARRPRGRPLRAALPGTAAPPLAAEAIPEDAPADPRNVYAATKLHQEHLASRSAARPACR